MTNKTLYTKEDMRKTYNKGCRNGSKSGMSVARGGEMNLITFDEWIETYKKK